MDKILKMGDLTLILITWQLLSNGLFKIQHVESQMADNFIYSNAKLHFV